MNEDRLDRIETSVVTVSEGLTKNQDRLDRIETVLERLTQDVEDLRQETARTNDRVETYQKASQQVVNLAFSLIVAATAAIVIPAVFGK